MADILYGIIDTERQTLLSSFSTKDEDSIHFEVRKERTIKRAERCKDNWGSVYPQRSLARHKIERYCEAGARPSSK